MHSCAAGHSSWIKGRKSERERRTRSSGQRLSASPHHALRLFLSDCLHASMRLCCWLINCRSSLTPDCESERERESQGHLDGERDRRCDCWSLFRQSGERQLRASERCVSRSLATTAAPPDARTLSFPFDEKRVTNSSARSLPIYPFLSLSRRCLASAERVKREAENADRRSGSRTPELMNARVMNALT